MTALATINIDEAMADPKLLGACLGDQKTWATWRVVLKAAFGLKLDDDERKIFATVARDRAPPGTRVQKLWALAGRRGGKSRMAALMPDNEHRGANSCDLNVLWPIGRQLRHHSTSR